jgi:uncharacterized membrane protein
MNLDMEFSGGARHASVPPQRNVGEAERWGSIAAGTALAIYGISRRNPSGFLLAGVGAILMRRGARGHCELYQAFDLNSASAGRGASSSDTRVALGGSAGVLVEESVTVDRPIDELYQFWRNLDNLPRFMEHLESVDKLTDTLSRWRARGPGGTMVEWNAEIINEVPNQVIGWRSLEGSDVVSAGSVNFDVDGEGRGTTIRVRLQDSPPGGKVGAAVAKLLGQDAATEIREDLRRFKQLIESGELSRTDTQPSA